jgi:hypothetical protein
MKFVGIILALCAILTAVTLLLFRDSPARGASIEEVIQSLKDAESDSHEAQQLWSDVSKSARDMSESEKISLSKKIMHASIIRIDAKRTEANQGWVELVIKMEVYVPSAICVEMDEVQIIFDHDEEVDVQTDTKIAEFSVESSFIFTVQLSPHQLLPEQRSAIQEGRFKMQGEVVFLREPSISLPWIVEVN